MNLADIRKSQASTKTGDGSVDPAAYEMIEFLKKRRKGRTGYTDVLTKIPLSGISFICNGLRVSNALNVRTHWRKRHAERSLARESVAVAMLLNRPWPSLPLIVTMIRVGPKRMDDDGLSASLKHVRDAVAEMLAVDDGDLRIRFECRQEVGEYEVRISIVHADRLDDFRDGDLHRGNNDDLL